MSVWSELSLLSSMPQTPLIAGKLVERCNAVHNDTILVLLSTLSGFRLDL